MSDKHITTLGEIHLGQALGQVRAMPIKFAADTPEAILLAYSADEDIDPFHGMFFFPSDTLKLVLWVPGEGIRWSREFHRGVIPGLWFSPIFPFDLDGDGVEEIWMVVNADEKHPLDIKQYGLEKIDPQTGATLERLPWHGLDNDDYTASQRYRHFLAGGKANGQPVLVCVQGTYSRLQFQGLGASGKYLWETAAAKDSPGARASHNCPVVDYDQDGNDEIFIGERCLRLSDGTPLLIADEHVYNGHSDVVAPFWDDATACWNLFTARETPYVNPAPPRVVAFGPDGRRLWADLEEGHMDMGWVARVPTVEGHLAYAMLLGAKSAGPEGFKRTASKEYFWNARSGEVVNVGDFSAFERIPVDIDGDGYHEFVTTNNFQSPPDIIDIFGRRLAVLPPGSRVAHVSKIFDDCPGEQIVTFSAEGWVRILGNEKGYFADSPAASARYAHPFYYKNRKFTGVGYNLSTLSGI